MPRVLMLQGLLWSLLGCSPQQAPAPPSRESLPEDAPRTFQIAVEGCQEVAVTGGGDPRPAERRVLTFTVPEGAEVLHLGAAWQDARRKRRVSAGPGTCPPCDAQERAKGYGAARLEVTVDAEQVGQPWFAAVECDPAVDDLGIDTPSIDVEVCRFGGSRGVFPTEGLDQGSQSIIEHGAFGMQGFDEVKTATYHGGGLLAFVATSSSLEEARVRADAYRSYLASLGGEPIPMAGLQSAVAVRTYGLTTIVFTRGVYVGGVQEAADGEAATALATRLADWLDED